jgi:DNA polymerase
MTTEEYIRDPRFTVFGACLHEYGSEEAPRWYNGDDLHDALAQYDWSKTAILAHNAQFDVSILEWKYDCHPSFILDTLSMGRALRGVEVGNSLAKLADEFGLPAKGHAVHSTDGLVELTSYIEAELAAYCAHDVELCEAIFSRFIEGYPAKELKLIDMTLRMYTQPKLILDGVMLTKAIDEERQQREELLNKLNIDEGDLASNPKFANLLAAVGVEPPMKVSKTTGKPTLALAKNDALFLAIMNGDNNDAAILCEARLKVKSTTERTRAQRFLDISKRGALPVPLSYYGAATGRWTASKGSAINMQNLKRGSFLRKAIMAPMGKQLVVGDLSQIEPRVLAWLADYEDMLDIFRSGGDPYAQFGSQMFNIPGMTKDSHPDLRQSAKSALLGCGYGLGWASFASQLLVGFLGAPPVRYERAFAVKLGADQTYVTKFLDWEENGTKLLAIPHTCSKPELLSHAIAAKKIIDIYRATAWPVVSFWNMCGDLLERCLVGGEEYTHKCLTFRKGEIVLPNGMRLHYPNLRKDEDKNWVYGKDATKLYPGKITNNVTQAVARIVMTDGMLRVAKRYPVVGTVHDELIAIAPEDEAQEALDWVLAQMTMEPKYLPGIPLAADGGTNIRYGDAKK